MPQVRKRRSRKDHLSMVVQKDNADLTSISFLLITASKPGYTTEALQELVREPDLEHMQWFFYEVYDHLPIEVNSEITGPVYS